MCNSICGANCTECNFKNECKGCAATCGSPFGGTCIAAEYIKVGGKEAYAKFKADLFSEINAFLASLDIPKAQQLFELAGSFVNLPYPLPSGEAVKFLSDKNIYLGSQIEFADLGVCYGVVANASFIMVCSYSVDGSCPELVGFKRR